MFIVEILTFISLAAATTRIPIHWSENYDAMIDIMVSPDANTAPRQERVRLSYTRSEGIHLLNTFARSHTVTIGGTTFTANWFDRTSSSSLPEQDEINSICVGQESEFFRTVGSYMITPTELIINPEAPEMECAEGSALETIAVNAFAVPHTVFANNGMYLVALHGKHEFFMSRTEYPAFMTQVREGLAEAGLTIGEDGRTINNCNIDLLNELLPVLSFRPVMDMDRHPLRGIPQDPTVEVEPRNYLRPTPGNPNTCTMAVRTRAGNMPYTIGSALLRKYAIVFDSRSSGRVCIARTAL
jgi:hypothetical protein